MPYTNLCFLWDMRQPYDLDHLDAYQGYNHTIGILAKHYNFPKTRCIAAFAALSPSISESQNYRALEAICLHLNGDAPAKLRLSGYGKNKAKAIAILSGKPIKDHLRGRKVIAFYNNILRPNDSEFVTVDGHLYNAWMGKRLNLTDPKLRVTDKIYDDIAADIRVLASRVSHPAPAVQAVLWFIWKRLNNILYDPQRVLPFEFKPLPRSCFVR